MSINRKTFFYVGFFIILFFSFSLEKNVEAKKYYSLQDIGLSGCTKDNIDYTIISIRGNKIKYAVYELSDKNCGWEQKGEIKTAVLTSDTKFYIGDIERISSDIKKKSSKKRTDKMIKQNRDNKNRHLAKKVKNIDTEKWLYRVRKGKAKRNLGKRNNELVVRNGKVKKIAIRLIY